MYGAYEVEADCVDLYTLPILLGTGVPVKLLQLSEYLTNLGETLDQGYQGTVYAGILEINYKKVLHKIIDLLKITKTERNQTML